MSVSCPRGIFYETGINPLLRLQHVNDIEYLTSLCLTERVDEVFEVRLISLPPDESEE